MVRLEINITVNNDIVNMDIIIYNFENFNSKEREIALIIKRAIEKGFNFSEIKDEQSKSIFQQLKESIEQAKGWIEEKKNLKAEINSVKLSSEKKNEQ